MELSITKDNILGLTERDNSWAIFTRRGLISVNKNSLDPNVISEWKRSRERFCGLLKPFTEKAINRPLNAPVTAWISADSMPNYSCVFYKVVLLKHVRDLSYKHLGDCWKVQYVSGRQQFIGTECLYILESPYPSTLEYEKFYYAGNRHEVDYNYVVLGEYLSQKEGLFPPSLEILEWPETGHIELRTLDGSSIPFGLQIDTGRYEEEDYYFLVGYAGEININPGVKLPAIKHE